MEDQICIAVGGWKPEVTLSPYLGIAQDLEVHVIYSDDDKDTAFLFCATTGKTYRIENGIRVPLCGNREEAADRLILCHVLLWKIRTSIHRHLEDVPAIEEYLHKLRRTTRDLIKLFREIRELGFEPIVSFPPTNHGIT